MIFESVILLAGSAVPVLADAPAAATANAAVASSPRTKDLLYDSTTDNGRPVKHRLLQKFKARKFRNRRKLVGDAGREDQEGGDEADLGVLSRKGDAPRFLEENDYDYYCPRDTCPSGLCDCADAGGSLEDCTDQLQAVCRADRLGDCVFKDYVHVYEEVYCPFVACTTEGFREVQCDCAFYDLYCGRLHGEECEEVLKTPSEGTDKKPFFGCDEKELKNVCDEAHACKGRGDLQGLPDLGTWKGSVQTGIRSSGGRVGGSVAVSMTLLSMLWLLVNV